MLTPAIRAMCLPCRLPSRCRCSPFYPCRCLCRGSTQMTRTTPLRRMILQLRQIFFTEASTFMSHLSSLRAEDDPRPGQVVWRQIHRHLVARQYLDVVHPHLPGDMPQHHVSVLQLHPESCVRQHFQDLALHLYRVFLRHQRVGSPPLKFAFFSRLSYCCDIMYACTCVMKSIVTTTMISSDVPPK